MNKVGNTVELVEVKAKSFRSSDPNPFCNASGGIDPKMLPYLRDIAFQRYVFSKAHPDLKVQAFLLLTDKDKNSSVEGLNKLFKVIYKNDKPEIVVDKAATLQNIGEPILSKVNVDTLVDRLLNETLAIGGDSGTIANLAPRWAQQLLNDEKPGMNIGVGCANCEFRASGDLNGKRNGFEECWSEAFELKREDFANGTVLDVWNFKGKQKLIDSKTYLFEKIEKEHLNYKESESGITTSQRQYMQVKGEWPGGGPFYFDRTLFASKMEGWTYPLHFIDFETAAVAIPFLKNQTPFSNVAFQFSVHSIQQDGSVVHSAEHLDANSTQSPNYGFVRELRKAVGEVGTVFMWSQHENSTLNQILRELETESNAFSDLQELRTFIQSLTRRKVGKEQIVGNRAMVDMCKLAEKTFFHPLTCGSCSIKQVLPAVLRSSEYLRQKYSNPIYGASGGISSRNFENKVWWVLDGEHPKNPYKQLDPVFSGYSDEELSDLESSGEMAIAEGGAATAAYTMLLQDSLPAEERRKIESALKQYCELDTLAMVMIFESWREWSRKNTVSF